MAWSEEQLLTGSLIVMFTTVMLAVQWYQSRLENDLVIEAAKRTQPHRRGTIDRAVQVPSEVWPRVIQHLTVQHLCMAQEVCSMFDQLSSCDKLWEAQCLQRWAGKQRIGNSLFPYADYSGIQLTKDECLTVLRARGVDTYRLRLPELQTAILSTPSWCSARMYGAERVKSKWKRSYFCAELDSHRQHISSAEVSHFRWQLVYHGQPSRYGLRHFRSDGTYESPYLGLSTWHLVEKGKRFAIGHGLENVIPVTRSTEDWGWVLGKGCATEYTSVEPTIEEFERDLNDAPPGVMS